MAVEPGTSDADPDSTARQALHAQFRAPAIKNTATAIIFAGRE